MRFVVKRALRASLAGLVLGCLGLWLVLLATASPLPGLRLSGTPLGDGKVERVLESRRGDWLAATVTIHTGPYFTRAPRSELGALRDVEDGTRRLLMVGRTGNPLADLSAFFGSLRGNVDVQWPIKVDQNRLLEFVRKLRRHMERPPIAGTMARDGRTIAGIPGITINAMLAVSSIKAALLHDDVDVTVATHQTPPPSPVGFDALTTHAKFGTLLGTFRTEYNRRGGESGRAINIEIAASKLDGVVVAPGDTLSFNEVVGERSLARGFQTAPEIANQLVVEGVGGGVCQTAATLHAVAFLAGFEIEEYRPHSRPMRYVPTGLDTMVWWPDKDLRIRNPYPFPVRVKTVIDPAGAIAFSLYGAGRAHPVDWNSEVLSSVPGGEKRVPDASLPPGKERQVQAAIDGLRIRRTRTIYFPFGPRAEEKELRYPPNPRVVAYGVLAL